MGMLRWAGELGGILAAATVAACGGRARGDQSAGPGSDATSTPHDATSVDDASLEDSSNAMDASAVPVDATADIANWDALYDVQQETDALADSGCPANLPPIQSGAPVRASIDGPNVSATLCPGAYVASGGLSPGPQDGAALFNITDGYLVSPRSGPAAMAVALPADATGGSLSASISITSSFPATYGNDATTCSSVLFFVDLPVPPSVDCDSGIIGSNGRCPDGCECEELCRLSSAPCLPIVPSIEYAAFDECPETQQGAQGSYTLVITSFDDSGIATKPNVHGTLNATVLNVDGGAGTANIQATF